jgi:hypothetical protein
MSFTTLDIGEESYDLAAPTTMATGEEGDPPQTTMAVGEEEREVTTDALGEEDEPKLSAGGVIDPFGAF